MATKESVLHLALPQVACPRLASAQTKAALLAGTAGQGKVRQPVHAPIELYSCPNPPRSCSPKPVGPAGSFPGIHPIQSPNNVGYGVSAGADRAKGSELGPLSSPTIQDPVHLQPWP